MLTELTDCAMFGFLLLKPWPEGTTLYYIMVPFSVKSTNCKRWVLRETNRLFDREFFHNHIYVQFVPIQLWNQTYATMHMYHKTLRWEITYSTPGYGDSSFQYVE